MEGSDLLARVCARVREAMPCRTIHIAVQSAGEGSDWLWFHVEEMVQGHRVGQPLNLPMKAAVDGNQHGDAIVDEIAAAIVDRLAR